MITIPQEKLRDFIRTVYDMSVPVGLGFIHAKPGSLSDDEVDSIIRPTGRIAASMDYVNGRHCKMTVFRADDGTLTIRDNWFDHSDDQLAQLLESIGVAHAA
jgi:hypothetical protein